MKRLSAVVPDEEYRRVERLAKAGAVESIAQLVREAVAEYIDKLAAGRSLNLRTIPWNRRGSKWKNTSRTILE